MTVYSDADRRSLLDIRDIPSVSNLDVVLGAFDAVVTVTGDEGSIEKAVTDISRTPGVKEAKPLVEVGASQRSSPKQVIGRRA